MNSGVMTRVAPALIAMQPLLNRLVFHGIETCRGQLDSAAARVRPPVSRTVALHALATSVVERMAPELSAAGFIKIRRGADHEEWGYRDLVHIVLSSATGSETESVDSMAREYAVLLTRTAPVGDGTAMRVSMRVSTPVAQLALYWRAHEASGASIMESEWIEDLIELVVRRREIIDEVSAAPTELRELIARSAGKFIAEDGCRWVLRRALPDTRQVPAFAEHSRERFVRLAALAAEP